MKKSAHGGKKFDLVQTGQILVEECTLEFFNLLIKIFVSYKFEKSILYAVFFFLQQTHCTRTHRQGPYRILLRFLIMQFFVLITYLFCFQRKLLAVYLHHEGSVLTNVFCTQLLCFDSVLQFLKDNFIVWGWDLTYESNRNK